MYEGNTSGHCWRFSMGISLWYLNSYGFYCTDYRTDLSEDDRRSCKLNNNASTKQYEGWFMENNLFISQDEWNHISEEDRQKIAKAVSGQYKDNLECEEVHLSDSFYVRYGKRIVDIFVGAVACVLFLPLNLILAIITFFDVGSPILFHQERVGKDGRIFSLIKFRNMTNEKNEQGILLPPEMRVTKWGRFVRQTSLDELMNFWSVLKGDMSVIGPRPLPKKYIIRFSKYHQQRHLVRPGLECPFHEQGLLEKGWQGRLDNDIWYVKHISLKTDLLMVFWLVKKVFSKEERIISASGKTGEFIGYCEDGSVMNEWMIPRKYLVAITNHYNCEDNCLKDNKAKAGAEEQIGI